MKKEELNQIRKAVKEQHALIHCITNPISINQCANAVLAVGARPIMAEHPGEVREITSTAQALLLNLGNITDTRMKSMTIAAATAKDKEIPVVADLVGIACSRMRRSFACDLISEVPPAVIKGNYSEINALYNFGYQSAGVDSETSLSAELMSQTAAELAWKYHSVILASGKIDIVSDGKKIWQIKNGTPQLACVTGTGCMLGALCGCYLSAGEAAKAAVTACAVLGICGSLAETERGSGSFMVHLMDKLSTLTEEELEQYLEWEEREVENI